jgi:deoxyribodipyrimidine photolyase-related protein
MGMYLDAYDWVMVPNVYGMSQFADGGSFATKPYISGANYIKKMSDYPSADWEQTWTALYWNFIATHSDVFKANHRLSMMPRLLEKMNQETKTQHFDTAKTYLSNS